MYDLIGIKIKLLSSLTEHQIWMLPKKANWRPHEEKKFWNHFVSFLIPHSAVITGSCINENNIHHQEQIGEPDPEPGVSLCKSDAPSPNNTTPYLPRVKENNRHLPNILPKKTFFVKVHSAQCVPSDTRQACSDKQQMEVTYEKLVTKTRKEILLNQEWNSGVYRTIYSFSIQKAYVYTK